MVVAIGGEGSADRSLPRQAIVVARYIVPFLDATNHQARALGRTSVKALCHLSKKWESIRRKPEKHQPVQKQISLEGCLGLPTANKDKPQTRHPYCVDSKHRKIVTRSLHSHPTSPTTYQPQCIQERRNCEQDIGVRLGVFASPLKRPRFHTNKKTVGATIAKGPTKNQGKNTNVEVG